MNTGSHDAMPLFDLKLRMFSPQPHWKVAITTPYAALTDSRRRNANSSTKPKTYGAACFIIEL